MLLPHHLARSGKQDVRQWVLKAHRLTDGSTTGPQGGCIIRAKFLDDIKQAYQRDPALENLLVDPFFAENLAKRQESWRRVVTQVPAASAAAPGLPVCLACL